MAGVPHHSDLVSAMLAYDLIGFQTDDDRRNFEDYLQFELGLRAVDGTVTSKYGLTQLATFPIGIDVDEFAARARQGRLRGPKCRACARACRAPSSRSASIASITRRVSPTGCARSTRMFELEPSLKGAVSLLQVAVPSRGNIRAYRELKSELAALVGEVNGRHGEVDWTPIRYLNKGFAQSTLAGFYRVAHVGLVTPLHDGMNLVAKEYVAAQNPFDPGVLVLSSFAGAAKELDAALLVNPHDIDGMARKIAQALNMSLDERRERWAQHGGQAAQVLGAELVLRFSAGARRGRPLGRRGPRSARRGGHAGRASISPAAAARCTATESGRRPSPPRSVFGFTEWICCEPGGFAPPAASVRRISSRFSWIEAMTGPVGLPKPIRAASESCRLASIVSGTASVAPELIEMAGVRGVARPRDDEDIGPQRADMRHDVVDFALGMDGDDDAGRMCQSAGLEEFRVAGVAVKHLVPLAAVAGHRRGVEIGRDIGDAVLLQQRADDLADAAVADDDRVIAPAGRADGEFGSDGRGRPQPRRKAPAREG